MPENRPAGKLFSDLYTQKPDNLQDSERFRVRLSNFLYDGYKGVLPDLGDYLLIEQGLSTRYHPGIGSNIKAFIAEIQISDLLDFITHAYRFFITNSRPTAAHDLLAFVERVFREERLAYEVDSKGGVHYTVDREFTSVTQSTLKFLSKSKYVKVAAEFEQCLQAIHTTPPDAKDATRHIFDCIEIVVRDLTGERRLTRSVLTDKVKPLVVRFYPERSTNESISKYIDSIGQWVDALHVYRHGQPSTEPQAPPLDLTIAFIHSGIAHLRWLIEQTEKVAAK